MSEFDPLPRTRVCLRKIRQFSRFINENRNKNGQKAFLNEKFIDISLFIGPRSKRVQLRVNFEANLSTRAEHVFQTFCNNCLEYEELINYNSIYLFIYLFIYTLRDKTHGESTIGHRVPYSTTSQSNF